VNIIRALIDAHTNINFQDGDGMTPLHHASKNGKSRAIPILIQKGADITVRDRI